MFEEQVPELLFAARRFLAASDPEASTSTRELRQRITDLEEALVADDASLRQALESCSDAEGSSSTCIGESRDARRLLRRLVQPVVAAAFDVVAFQEGDSLFNVRGELSIAVDAARVVEDYSPFDLEVACVGAAASGTGRPRAGTATVVIPEATTAAGWRFSVEVGRYTTTSSSSRGGCYGKPSPGRVNLIFKLYVTNLLADRAAPPPNFGLGLNLVSGSEVDPAITTTVGSYDRIEGSPSDADNACLSGLFVPRPNSLIAPGVTEAYRVFVHSVVDPLPEGVAGLMMFFGPDYADTENPISAQFPLTTATGGSR